MCKDVNFMAVPAKAENAKKTNSLVRYLQDVKAEFKKITWPTKDDVVKSTVIVIIYMAFFTLILSAYDSVFHYLLEFVLSKLK